MKRYLLTAGGGLLCILLTVLILESGASTIRGRESAATPDFTLETPDMSDVPDLDGDTGMDSGATSGDRQDAVPADPADGGDMPLEEKPVRDIAPEQFGLPDAVTTEPLQRIEPRVPLSDPVARPQPVASVLRHPVALSAGLIDFDGRLLQLDGLAPQQADRVCGEAGRTWPCGVVARTAFRNFLRARALTCMVPKNGWQGTVTAACTIGTTDPARWLAESGWADAPDTSPLAAAIATARQAKLGFYGEDPRDRAPTPAPLDEIVPAGDIGTQQGL